MLSLKPYLTLQQYLPTQGEEEAKTILYIGIVVLVPDGYTLMLRPSNSIGPSSNTCIIRLELFRARGQRHYGPHNFLSTLKREDSEELSNVTQVRVEIGFNPNTDVNVLENPFKPTYPLTTDGNLNIDPETGIDPNWVAVGTTQIAVEGAGAFIQENGLTCPVPRDNGSATHPPLNIEDLVNNAAELLPIEQLLTERKGLIPRIAGPHPNPSDRGKV